MHIGINYRDQRVWYLCATLVLDHHSNSIQLHLISSNIRLHLHDFRQQNKVHVTPIFLGARAGMELDQGQQCRRLKCAHAQQDVTVSELLDADIFIFA